MFTYTRPSISNDGDAATMAPGRGGGPPTLGKDVVLDLNRCQPSVLATGREVPSLSLSIAVAVAEASRHAEIFVDTTKEFHSAFRALFDLIVTM